MIVNNLKMLSCVNNKNMSTNNIIKDFKVLPVRIFSNSSCHHMFVKEHTARTLKGECDSAKKTLFVINVPPYIDEYCLKAYFSKAGSIIKVILQNEDSQSNGSDGFKKAYIIFEKRESLIKCLKTDILDTVLSETPLKVGMKKWIEEYNCNIYNSEDLSNKINLYMAKYDKEENKNISEKNIVDDEGWTLVTKKGRKPGVSRKESVENKLNEQLKTKSRKKELKNFYAFQIRESKRKNIADLRKSFEEVKEKVNLMKKNRKFKPY